MSDRAPKFTDSLPAAGEMLCSEPWDPCWEPATHYRITRKGYSVTCYGCSIAGPETLSLRAAALTANLTPEEEN